MWRAVIGFFLLSFQATATDFQKWVSHCDQPTLKDASNPFLFLPKALCPSGASIHWHSKSQGGFDVFVLTTNAQGVGRASKFSLSPEQAQGGVFRFDDPQVKASCGRTLSIQAGGEFKDVQIVDSKSSDQALKPSSSETQPILTAVGEGLRVALMKRVEGKVYAGRQAFSLEGCYIGLLGLEKSYGVRILSQEDRKIIDSSIRPEGRLQPATREAREAGVAN